MEIGQCSKSRHHSLKINVTTMWMLTLQKPSQRTPQSFYNMYYRQAWQKVLFLTISHTSISTKKNARKLVTLCTRCYLSSLVWFESKLNKIFEVAEWAWPMAGEVYLVMQCFAVFCNVPKNRPSNLMSLLVLNCTLIFQNRERKKYLLS